MSSTPPPTMAEATTGRRRARRGFAAMDPGLQQELASLGGRIVHQQGKAPAFTSEGGRLAAQKRHAKKDSPDGA